MPDIYFEDFEPGRTSIFGARSITADEIVAFAREFDPQPFHVDPEAARATFAGELIASGWHTTALLMRLIFDEWLAGAAGLGSPGIDKVDWLRPVRPGDVLRVRQTILDATPSRSRPAMGVVRFRFEALNGDDAVVLRQENPIMFSRREPGSVEAASPRGTGVAARPATPDVAMPEGDPAPPRPPELFEDVVVGRTEILGRRTVDADEIVRFARAFDPQPFHLSDEAAAKTHFGRLSASGWHTAGLWMRALVGTRAESIRVAAEEGGTGATPWGPSPGFTNLRWPKPVHAGDTLLFATTPVDKRSSRSRPGWGLVASRNAAWNERGQLVFAFEGSGFLKMREA